MCKEVSKNYYNIPSKLNKNEVLIYYSLCENTNFSLDEYEGREKFECFCSVRTLSEDTLLSTRIVSNVLEKLEECGYIELISKGKPPKTPSKYKLTYAENIKKSVTLNVPLNVTLNETMQSIENKGIDNDFETLNETMNETLNVTPSKDISNNIYSAKNDEDSEMYMQKIDDIWDRLNNKYDYELIQREKKKLIDKDLKGLDLLIELERQLEKHNKKTDKNNLDKEVEEIWKLYPLKKGKANAIKKIPSILKKYGKEQLKRCVERYIKDVEYQRANKFRDLNYKNGSTFFNGGYVDYLDCNYEEIKAKDIQQSEIVQVEEDNFEY